jgi:hypothetical protein
VGKIARERSTVLVSRSGLWLIGGTLLLSAAVLAWAFQSDAPAGHVREAGRRQGIPKRAPTRGAPTGFAAPAARRGESLRLATIGSSRRSEAVFRPRTVGAPLAGARSGIQEPASVAGYTALLQGDAFRPRVVPRRRAGSGSPSRPPAGGRPAQRPAPEGSAAAALDPDGAWRGWKFNGVAQLDQQTYALMDQPNQKQSRFVREGDRLENATIARVTEGAVILRQADGTVVRVPRVDAMADLLRPARTVTGSGPSSTPQGTMPAPATSSPGQGPVTILPSGQAIPPGSTAAADAAEGAPPAGSFGRRGRRFRQQDDAGDTGFQ